MTARTTGNIEFDRNTLDDLRGPSLGGKLMRWTVGNIKGTKTCFSGFSGRHGRPGGVCGRSGSDASLVLPALVAASP